MDFISIADSKINGKGDIVVTVTNIGDLKAGTSSNGDWRKKVITILDASCSESITAWNDDIEKFQLNHKYELTGIYWKEHNGKSYLNFGKYSKAKDLGVSTEPNQSTIDDTPKENKVPTPEQYLDNKRKEIENKILSIATLDDKTNEYIDKKTIELYLINQRIKKKLEEFENIPNGGMIGQFTQIIRDEYKGEIKVILTQKESCCNNPVPSSVNDKVCQNCNGDFKNEPHT